MWRHSKNVNLTCRILQKPVEKQSVPIGNQYDLFINNLNNVAQAKKSVFTKNLSYCKWAVSKSILKNIPNLQNCGVRTYTTFQRNVVKNMELSRRTSLWSIIRCDNSDLSMKYLRVLVIPSCEIHKTTNTDSKTLKSAKRDVAKNIACNDFKSMESLTPVDCFTDKESVNFPEDFEDKDHDKISKIFPRPKEVLNHLKNILGPTFMDIQYSQKTNLSKVVNKRSKHLPGNWKATIRISWPNNTLFHHESATKSQSGHKASVKVVHWLYVNKHIDENGNPIHSSDAIKAMKRSLHRPIELSINFEEETAINTMYKMYISHVEPFIKDKTSTLQQEKIPLSISQDHLATADFEEFVDSDIDKSHGQNVYNLKLASEMEYFDPIYRTSPAEKNIKEMKERNVYLNSRLEGMDIDRVVLPISGFKDNILKTVENNRVVVIRGAPGCGKSTRTPSYILNDWIQRGMGAECNIIVSQPRRVAALSLASRVAHERGDRYVGNTVGHQVRMSTKLPRAPGGGILYCTAGSLLRRLATSPQLPGCTHLILDEAHERSADSDTVMTLAKTALQLNPKIKVIVMSATIDTQLFSKYYDDCPILDIPGFTYPVQSYFLKDIMNMCGLQLVRTLEHSKPDSDNVWVDAREVVQVVSWLHKNKPDGAILVFLPGWEQIKKVKEDLDSIYNDGSWVVLPVHSRLSNDEQRKIFDRQLDGVRKIVLSTNIAETSITIDDVAYVVDTGIHKEHKLMAEKGISSLDSNWISKSSVAQRKGRAGRVKPGECFHLYTIEKMESFAQNNLPEILRIPLEKTVLDCKTYKEDAKALDFLGQFPQPPDPAAIEVAVKDLIDLGALDGEENLTALGRRIASFTCHPKISKALIHSAIFQVASPIIDLSAILSNNIDIYSCSIENRAASRNLKKSFHPTSDHLAVYWLCRNFENLTQKKTFSEIIYYCKRNHLRRERINSVIDFRKIYVEHLKHSKMLPSHANESSHNLQILDEYSSVDELVKGVLLSGLNTLLQTKNIIKTRGKLTNEKGLVSDQGQRAFLATSSVNHSILKSDIDALLLYCGAVHSHERRGLLVRSTSVIHPLTAFLFSQKVTLKSDKDGKHVFSINNKINLECNEDQGECLSKLREMIWNIINYYIENQGFTNVIYNRSYSDESEESSDSFISKRKNSSNEKLRNPVDTFKEELLFFLSELLNKSEIVSYDDATEKTKPKIDL